MNCLNGEQYLKQALDSIYEQTYDDWEVILTNGFKNDGTSVFTGMVIPAPPVAIALFTIAFGYTRRRH